MKQAATASFITRKGGFFQEQDIEAVAGEGQSGGTAGGAGADHGDVMTFHSLKIADFSKLPIADLGLPIGERDFSALQRIQHTGWSEFRRPNQ